jgi:hypothetical protein
VRTVVISDLHLGTRTAGDVLARPAPLAALTRRLEGAGRLVLLGDTLELRHGPARDALARARPVLMGIGAALGGDAEVVLVPGNHDHQLLRAWLDVRARHGPPPPLGLEQRIDPGDASWVAAEIAQMLAPARTEVAYPGLWLRGDVYATHGHYGDPHTTVPTFERLAAGAVARVFAPLPVPAACPDDYERVLAPLYALQDALAERVPPDRAQRPAGASVAVWELLAAGGGDGDDGGVARRRRRALGLLLRGALPVGVAAVNRLGIGPVRSDLSPIELRRSGVAATLEAARRLQVGAPHLICGHTHRTGPLPADDPADWRAPAGPSLTNSGCWIYEAAFARRGPASPYWPGGVVEVGEEGPPALHRLLDHLPATALLG